MNILVVYDSYFGNTEKVAQAIGAAFGPQHAVCVAKVGEVKPEQMQGLGLLVAGSPTRAFQASPGMKQFLGSLPAGALKGVKVAAFDTRIPVEQTNSGFLKFMVKLFGYAAKPMSGKLQKKGGTPAGAPEGFLVQGTEGPLLDGELQRAADWAKKMI